MTLDEKLLGIDAEWKNMSIAPKDGSEILVYDEHGLRHVATFHTSYNNSYWRGSTGEGCESWFGEPLGWQDLPDVPKDKVKAYQQAKKEYPHG